MKRFSILFFAVAISLAAMAESQNGAVYVKLNGTGDGSSWENAMGNIAKAISKAKGDSVTGDAARKDVWVAAGEYILTECLNMIDSVNVYGGFAGTETSVEDRVMGTSGKPWDFVNATILKGDSCRLVQGAVALDQETVFDGFTLTNGNGVGKQIGNSGGAAALRPNIVLQNCIVKNCTATNAGGGVTMYPGGTVRRCLIKDNISYGTSNGGGGINVNANNESWIEDCEITGNRTYVRGGGMNVQGNGIIHISGCKIYNNVACDASGNLMPGGAIRSGALKSEITNNLIYNNTGTNAVYAQTGLLANNTIVKNVGGLYIASSTALGQIANNIIWACYADEACTKSTSLSGVAISNLKVWNNATYHEIPTEKDWDIANNYKFPSNITNGDVYDLEDATILLGSGPKFARVSSFIGAISDSLSSEDAGLLLADLDSVDWRLKAASPCVNTGCATDTILKLIVSDIDGVSRPQGFPIDSAKYDMGAYELAYHAILIGEYNAEKGQILDDNATELPSDTILGVANGQTVTLYFMANKPPIYKVTTTLSIDGGLTYTGTETDITAEINDIGMWTCKVTAPFKINVQWVNSTALSESNSDKITCITRNGQIELNGLTAGEVVSVYHVTGKLVSRQVANSAVMSIGLEAGVYVVHVADSVKKVILK